MGKDYDLIIFGASGYSAIFIIEELIKSDNSQSVKWAIAGRNKTKLVNALNTVTKNSGINLEHVPIILGDVKDEVTLNELCSKTRLIMNCVGPYLWYGESVVRAAIKNNCDYIDLCGETLFLEEIQLKYNIKAQEANIFVIGACGFDSVPSDMGVIFAQSQFDGDLNGIEGYCQFIMKKWTTGPSINYTTFLSAVQSFTHMSKLRSVRKALMPKQLPKNPYSLRPKPLLFQSSELQHNGWCIPFPGTDKSVIQRTQYYFYEHDNRRPIQFRPYFRLKSLFFALATIVMGAIIMIMSKFDFTRKLMEQYPRIFTGGQAAHGGPSRDDLANASFQWTLVGKGYKEKRNDPQLQHDAPPDKTIKVIVTGPDAYKSTAICITQVALTLLQEREKMPTSGGVYTTGVAFHKTSLIQRLQDHDINFKVLDGDK